MAWKRKPWKRHTGSGAPEPASAGPRSSPLMLGWSASLRGPWGLSDPRQLAPEPLSVFLQRPPGQVLGQARLGKELELTLNKWEAGGGSCAI